jgi:pimeloyl-ACP methyl ester carboxylesterase
MDIIVENLFLNQDCRKLPVPAFFVRSTAPSNVEDPPCECQPNQPTIADVIDILYRNSQGENQESGLVIAIHGYNTGADVVPDGVRQYWYQPLSNYVNQDSYIQKKSSSLVFLGYRWPSESLKKKGIRNEARQAMPVMLGFLLYNGIFIAVVALLLVLFTSWTWITIAAILGTVGFSIVLAVYLLRISVYFRDSYRATMFGVPDLVELIRQLDQGLIERTTRDNLTDEAVCDRIANRVPDLQALDRGKQLEALQSIRRALSRYPDLVIDLQNDQFQSFLKRVRHDISSDISDETLLRLTERFVLIQTLEYDAAERYWQKNPIKLSFLGHSMGGHVTTQVIRILSDVFDSRSIGKVGDADSQKTPSSRLGRVFRLGRLVLVAPDIPVLTITSGRTNFLKSALRRFEEAYLFSNEGDLALRLASTAANYFSFPARTRTQGYRLGNVTVSQPEQTKSKSKGATSVYGIVNLKDVAQFQGNLLRFLEINVLNKDRNQRLDPSSQQAEKQATGEAVASVQEDREAIADLFTYFDCVHSNSDVSAGVCGLSGLARLPHSDGTQKFGHQHPPARTAEY